MLMLHAPPIRWSLALENYQIGMVLENRVSPSEMPSPVVRIVEKVTMRIIMFHRRPDKQ